MPDVAFGQDVSFYGFDDTERVHRLCVEGEKIWNLLFARDNDFGGWLVEISGLMGKGKTSLMLEMVRKIRNDFPEETILWREPVLSPLQILKLDDNFELFSEKSFPLKVFQLGKNRPIPTDKYKIRYFDGPAKLLDMVRPGQTNVIYFKKLYKWVELMIRLRFNTSWQSIFLDEAEDICPSQCSNKGEDKSWTYNHKLIDNIKQIRKSRVNVICNTQSSSDIFWRFRKKIMMHFYLSGSTGDQLSPVFQPMLQNLKTGEGIVDLSFSRFGKISFSPYTPKDKMYAVFPVGAGGRILRTFS